MTTRLIGEPVERREDARLLTGRARFIDDIHLPGMLHAAVLRSPHAKARFTGIDASAALALPGVHAVITHEDLGSANAPMPLLNEDPGFIHPRTHQALAPGRVRFVGEAVALVVADSRYLAEDALDLIAVDYAPEAAAVDLVAAAEPGAPLVHDDTDSNIACRTADRSGNIESAFAAADFVLREELRPERGAAQPMETRGVVARYDASLDQLTIWDTTQAPVAARGVIAEKLGLSEAAITVIAPDVGGGFGVKIFLVYPEELLIPFAARLLGRPIKWIEDRREHFIGSNHERLMVHRIEVAASKDGHILGIKDHFLYDSGAYCPYGPINAQCAQAILPGPYKIPAVHTEYEAVYTNTPVVSPYRGAGQPHGNFVMEAAMNHVARALGLDAAEIRRRNLVRPEDCPWNSGRIFQGNTPLIHRDNDYPAQLAKTLDALDYAGVKRSQPAAREQGIFRGVGIAFFVEGTGISPYEGVEVRCGAHRPCARDDRLSLAGAGPSHDARAGGGGDPEPSRPSKVVVESGRSDRFAWGVGTFASRSAVIGGSAALGAARAVRARALNLASDELEAAPEDLVLADCAVHVKGAPQMAVTLAALARAADPINTLESGTEPGLRAADYYRSPRRRVRERSPRA